MDFMSDQSAGGQLILNAHTEVFGSDQDEYEAQQLGKLTLT